MIELYIIYQKLKRNWKVAVQHFKLFLFRNYLPWRKTTTTTTTTKNKNKKTKTKKKKQLEMCQYDTDAPAQGHHHQHAVILQKNEV